MTYPGHTDFININSISQGFLFRLVINYYTAITIYLPTKLRIFAE